MHLFRLSKCKETVSTKRMKYFSWLSVSEGRESEADSSYLSHSTQRVVAYKSFVGTGGQGFPATDEPAAAAALSSLPRFPFPLFQILVS